MKRFTAVIVCVFACRPVAAPATQEAYIPPPNPVVPATGDDNALCAKLGMLGCSDAWPRKGSCVEMFTQVHTDNIQVPYACYEQAKTVDDIRKCGDPKRELTLRCK